MTEMAGARKRSWNLKFETKVIILSYKLYAEQTVRHNAIKKQARKILVLSYFPDQITKIIS